ncbi:MAG: tetratricopeptide repeat protein [Planctomycetes bacterium]|nr:tetratricopeptide repeat protein [Planctomycetota bacterium]
MTRRLLILLLVLPLVGALARAEDDEGAKLLRQGLERLQRGDYEGALAKFRDAQIEHPESREIHFDIGMALYKLERWADARAAFETAAHAADAEIEKKALFHAANCAVKEGKYQEALDGYNRALAVDEGYEVAKRNREWLIRKLKELERQRQEQQKKDEEQKDVAQKLQALIERQLELHAGLRAGMAVLGRPFGPSRLREAAALLDADPPARYREALMERLGADPGEAEKETLVAEILEKTEPEQKALLDDLRALIEEARQKVAGSATTQPGGPPQGDPETVKLQQAIPLLEQADEALARALRAAGEEQDPVGLHGGQESGLQAMLAALDLLLDELARLIKDQALLHQDGFEFLRTIEDETAATRPSPELQRDRGVEQGQQQKGLRDRCEALARHCSDQVTQGRAALEEAQAPGGPGIQPGQDPTEQLRRLETALGHLEQAADHMEQAEAELPKPDFQAGLEQEKLAYEELIKARAALQPPQQGGNQKSDQQQQNQQQQNQQQNQEDGQERPPEQQDGQEQKQDGQPEQNPDQPSGADQKQDGQEPRKTGDEAKEMSEEQARKTLQRVRDRELERRREEQDERQRAARGGRRKVEKDW